MNNKREIRVPFGILNIAGLMETKPVLDVDDIVGSEVVVPLFCHDTYKIKPTFNRKLNKEFAMMPDGYYYQKKFRRMVLWDFGDGHTEEGYSVEHSYSKPGRYRVSCTFYDINRRAWKNTYSVILVVKEILPTQLRFDDNFTKSSISCSKIEQIAKLEATLSTTCKEDLQVQVKRIFSEEEVNSNYEEIGRSFAEVPSEIFKYTRKYWTFLENTQQLLFQSDKVHRDNLKPTDLYTPNYIQLYGNFYYDQFDEEEPIKIHIYQVIPYKTIDDDLKTVRILNPNCKVDELLAHDGDNQDYLDKFTRVIDIQQIYLQEQLPKNVTPIGKRAWVDIFYKNDYLGNPNEFSFFYDIETKNITKELLSSDNYLNMMPLGLTIEISKTDVSLVNIGVSLDGFLREVSDKSYTVDEYLTQALVKGIDLDFYFFPYVKYENEQTLVEGLDIEISEETTVDFKDELMYYVPKDCEIQDILITSLEIPNNSVWNQERGIEVIEPWLKRANMILFDLLSFDIDVIVKDKGIIRVEMRKDPLIKPDELEIPTERMVKENIDELIDVYMAHPMFNETDNAKDFFKLVLKGQNMLNYTLTKSAHFLDDNMNVKTCYLSNLISMLKMMGEDVVEYEQGAFEGVNDLKDFVRILSMNHGDLVGHVVNDKHDIVIRHDKKGKNVGDKILITDELTIHKGKIVQLKRGDKVYDYTEWDKNGVEVIIQDKYTFDTKIVNLGLCGNSVVKIQDYIPSWGWNLLLPSRFDDCIYKFQQNEKYKKEHGRDLYSQTELKRIQQVINQLIDGYYSFYVLDPQTDTYRIGNFLESSTITDRINDPQKWDEEWGITHEIIMKILRDSGNYKHNKEIVNTPQTFNLRRNVVDVSSIIDVALSDINVNVYRNNILDDRSKFNGHIKAFGYLNESGESTFEMQLINGYINGKPLMTEEEIMSFRVIVEDGYIKPTKQVYNVQGGEFKGQIAIKLCGKVKKHNGKTEGLLWDVSIDLFSDK